MALRVVEEARNSPTRRLHGLVDELAVLERLRAAVVALQAATVVRFARARVEREPARDVHPRDVGRGVVEEVGLACRVSPSAAARRLGSARAWWFDLPRTYAALAVGAVSEQTAEAVVSETRHLDGPTRRAVDARLHDAGLEGKGAREAAALPRRYA